MLPQEEEALLSEMDVTGQAFEDMQEQNSRLLQQLREKDDANFKLMSERIKSNQIYKLLKEEKEELADQVLTFKTQVTYIYMTDGSNLTLSVCKCIIDRSVCGYLTGFCRCPSGGCSAPGRTEAGGKRGRPSEHAGRSGKRAHRPHASTRTQQEEGEMRKTHSSAY